MRMERKYMDKNALEKQVLLSISVMASGRQETTEKCIASLDKLRERVSSELIVTDTGCQPKLRAWLEDHADKVIDFTWCNDFAAARNVGLDAANGEWFLYLDDDEWFEDTQELEEFFNSGEYRQYKSALYKVRNYADIEGKVYRDSYLSRMVRLQEDTRFLHPIHETLSPIFPPMKYLEDYVHHYGYAYTDKEQEKAKRERNLSLLFQAIEEDRHCMRHYMQCMTEYAAAEDYENSLNMAYEGIRQYDPSRWDNDRYIQALYAAVVRRLLNRERYEEGCREAKRLIELEDISPLAAATICGDVTLACFKTGAYKQGLQYLESYLELKEAFEGNRQAYLEQQTMLLETCFEPEHYRWVMRNGLRLASAAGDREALNTLLGREEICWWEEALDTWKSLPEDWESLCAGFEGIMQEDDMYHLNLYVSMYRNLILRMEDETEDFVKLHKMIGHYAQKVVLLYQQFFKPEIMERFPQLLPEEYRGALWVQKAAVCAEKQMYVEALRALKAAVEIHMKINPALSIYAALIGRKAGQEQEERRKAASEMELLGGQLKDKISRLTEAGETGTARSLVTELRRLMPEDDELEALEAAIHYREIKNRFQF